MSICLLIRTDGRDELLVQTVTSANYNLRGVIKRKVIHTDAGDDHRIHLQSVFPTFEVIGGQRVGFGAAIDRAWRLCATGSEDYLFDLEDDFLFNREVALPRIISVLEAHPYIVQMALRRQPWNESEKKAGGIVEQWPDTYDDKSWQGSEWLEHRNFLTSNPSLWRMETCRQGWPLVDHSEAAYSQQTFDDPTLYSAYWGSRDSHEWVNHIGEQRAGHSY